MSLRPRIAISMGDPSGIGPEVTVAALTRRSTVKAAQPILVGDTAVFAEAAERHNRKLFFVDWSGGGAYRRDTFPVVSVSKLTDRQRRPGNPTLGGGRAAHAAIVAAAQLAADGVAEAIVTAPICKANLAAAGCGATGHTELLAELAGGADVRMMMVGSRLRVALVTTHLALADVPKALDRHNVCDTIVIADRALREDFGLRTPRIAVAGLNPHAGESGLYGREEIEIIKPAVTRARRRGIDVTGPIAADSAFPLALQGKFDLIVCMYHDQALAPFKTMHFSDGVNFTAGLPFIRTSPDHGTAHDIAGRGLADATSMCAAINTGALAALARRGEVGEAPRTRQLAFASRKAE